jgi:hypothetical protein
MLFMFNTYSHDSTVFAKTKTTPKLVKAVSTNLDIVLKTYLYTKQFYCKLLPTTFLPLMTFWR